MALHTPPRRSTRGTILVASPLASFTAHAVPLVEAAGFRAVLRVAGEAAWLTCTRTRPHLVVVDGTPGGTEVLDLLDEVMVRRLPLLVAHDGPAYDVPRLLGTHARLGWLSTTFTAAELADAIERLLPTEPPSDGAPARSERAVPWGPSRVTRLGDAEGTPEGARERASSRLEPDGLPEGMPSVP